MKHHHRLTSRLIAGILFISLCLQSCKGFSNQALPQLYTFQQKAYCLTETNHRACLINQEFVAEKGCLVSFHEEHGNLQANVKTDASQKEPNYTNLPVVIAKDVNLIELARLERPMQQRFMHVERSSTGKPSRIIMVRGGLKGGMMEGDTQSTAKDLMDIIELRSYFKAKRGYLEVTPQNYEKIMEACQKYTSSFINYDEGLFINKWEDSKAFSDLSELLDRFSKVTKLTVRCNMADKAALAEVLAGSIQFYKDLTELDLNGCQLGDAMMEDMIDAIRSKNLKLVHVVDNQLSSELIAHLQEEFSAVTFITQASEDTPGTPRCRGNTRANASLRNSPSNRVRLRDTATRSDHSSKETFEKENEQELPIYIPSEELTAYGRLGFNKCLPSVPKSSIVYGERLGQGGMGIVFKAIYQGETVAVKKLTNSSIASFQKEAMIMANHRHPNLIHFLGYCPEEYAFMMEYAAGGSLWSLLKSTEEISWQKRYAIALDVAEGMNYLHDNGVVHCDLKSDNILLDSNLQAKITDFGISALRSEHVTSGKTTYGTLQGGTYCWMAPEIFHTNKSTKPGDVYAYGMVLWQLGARKAPFAGVQGLIPYIAAGNNEVITSDTPQGIKKVIELCWLPEPPLKKATDKGQRPTMRQVRRWLETSLEEEEKELAHQLELEGIIAKLPQGNEILAQLKSTKTGETLDFTNNYKVLNTDQRRIIFQHPCFKQTKLRLRIGRSEVQELALTLPNTEIHTLDLSQHMLFSGKQLGDEGASKLAQALPNTKIHTLDLSRNYIGDEGVSKLALVLANTKIHTLNLSGSLFYVVGKQLSDEGASKLALVLPNTQIHTLDLSRHQIGTEGASKIALTLPNTKIHTLNLNFNNIRDEGVSKLALALPNIQIHTLGLSNNHIGDEGATKIALALPNTQIHTLDLSGNHIGDEGSSKLAQALPSTQIHTLDLSDNHIDTEGASKLAQALPNTKIHTLKLRGDIDILFHRNIGVEGSTKIALALPNTKIHTLDLSGNHIGDEGTRKLALALPNTQIHTLDLSDNNIADEGATKIAQALPNTQIHTLHLSDNNIADEGATKIAQALPNTQIHTLHLSDNNIADEGAIKIAQALPNTQIHTLYLSGNKIAEETKSSLKNQFPHIQFYF